MNFSRLAAPIFVCTTLAFGAIGCAPAIKEDAWKVPPGSETALIICERSGSWDSCNQTARDMCANEFTLMEKQETDKRKEMKIHCRPK